MKDRLVAHRGDMTQYIENTLPAIQAAIDLRMSWIEIDIQISKDGVPIVVHDNELTRIAGRQHLVTDLDAAELVNLPINLTAERQSVTQLPTLAQVVDLLNVHPDITLFVEVKKESVATVGLTEVTAAVMSVLKLARFPVVVISFLYEVAELAKAKYRLPMGWVLTDLNQASKQRCETLNPEFIFCNVNKVREIEDLWVGDWRWVLYDIKDPAQAGRWLQAEYVMIETGDIFKLMNSSILN